MGEVTGRLSDLTILSSDNPRSEDPLKIISDIIVGLQKTAGKYLIEPDREKAVGMAMEEAAAETSCCWLERVTRIIRFLPTGRLSLTIAKSRGAPCANVVLKGRETTKGMTAVERRAAERLRFGT